MNGIAKLAAIAALSLSATGADAAILVQWTGTVTSGIDTLGVFSDPGTDLTGMTFTATYRMDPTKGNITQGSNYYYAEGGSDFGTSETPFLGGTMRINSHSFYVGNGLGDFLYDVQGSDFSRFETSGAFLTDDFTYGFMIQEIADNTSGNYGDLPIVPISTDVSGAADWNAGEFYFQNETGFTDLQLFNSHLTVSSIPEPVSWATMVAGFGLAGAAMRRRAARSVA